MIRGTDISQVNGLQIPRKQVATLLRLANQENYSIAGGGMMAEITIQLTKEEHLKIALPQADDNHDR